MPPVVPFPGLIGQVAGVPGERFDEGDVAKAWGVRTAQVIEWIEKGLLTAAWTRSGHYRIRMKSLRRAVLDHPEVAEAVLRPKTPRTRR